MTFQKRHTSDEKTPLSFRLLFIRDLFYRFSIKTPKEKKSRQSKKIADLENNRATNFSIDDITLEILPPELIKGSNLEKTFNGS